MKNIAAVLILSLCFSSAIQAQKRKKIQKLTPVHDTIYINKEHDKGKSYLIDAYIGRPKQTIPDMLFFNPYDECKIHIEQRPIRSKSDQKKNYALDLNMQRFYNIEKSNFDVSAYYAPFYFKKSEVTNKDYRDFVHWVRDSLAHDIVGNYINFCDATTEPFEIMDWETIIDWTDPALDELFVIEEGKRKELNKDLLVYVYQDQDGKEHKIPVYPAPIHWAAYYYSQPYLGLYFEHPALDYHPVINISYHQAIAFCHWKEKMLREELNKQGFEYDIEVGLPTVYEWEWIASSKSIGSGFLEKVIDESWNTDLLIEQEDGEILMKEVIEQSHFTVNAPPIHSSYYTDYAIGFEGKAPKPYKVNQEDFDENTYYKLLAVDKNGVYHMADNISEWIDYNYQDGWNKSLQRYIQELEDDGSREALLVRQIVTYYDSLNDKHGQLVYGSNWLDGRYSYVQSKNKAGIFAKRFINPNEVHSTIGFRYVIRLNINK